MSICSRSFTLILCLAMLVSPLAALDLKGRVRLVEDGSTKDDHEVRFAVVYFEPARPVVPAPLAEPLEITMTRKSFSPRVLAVPVGSQVRFPNDDRILHNVFSLSPGNRFDLGLYRRGQAKETVFQRPGVVQVFCNVHHSMVAYVLVLGTPFFAQPDRNGNFVLHDLPAGPGRLSVWHERADLFAKPLAIPSAGVLDIDLRLTKPRVPPHRNKFGKPYKRTRRGKAY